MTNPKLSLVAIALLVGAYALVQHDRLALARAQKAHVAAIERAEKAKAHPATPSHAVTPPPQKDGSADASGGDTAAASAPATDAESTTSEAYRQLFRAAAQQRRHLQFQALYRKLKLTPEQIAQFESAMVKQEEAKLDAADARQTGGDEQAIYFLSGAEWNQNMQAILGQEGFAQMQDYMRSMPVRTFLNGYAVQLAETGSPITQDQATQLASIALANDSMYQQGKGTDPGTVNWTAAWEGASKVLNEDQLALLQRTVEVWSLQKQISLRLKSQTATHP
jgi:hypothetical protein